MPIRNVAPTLGEHTAQVLARVLGFSPEQILALECQGITGTTAQPKASTASTAKAAGNTTITHVEKEVR